MVKHSLEAVEQTGIDGEVIDLRWLDRASLDWTTIGESIKVISGPLSDFTGEIAEINAEQGRVKVLVSIFGRETPAELSFDQVKKLT
jgi:hypothetical protein